MEFITRHKKVWAVLAILTTVIVILFTIFGGAEEEEVAMRGKVETVCCLGPANDRWVRAFADEAYARNLSEGMPVKVMTQIMPAMTVDGNVETVSTEAETLPSQWQKETGAVKGYQVIVSVDDPKEFLKIGEDVLVIVK